LFAQLIATLIGVTKENADAHLLDAVILGTVYVFPRLLSEEPF
jgi:hypothetical protein